MGRCVECAIGEKKDARKILKRPFKKLFIVIKRNILRLKYENRSKLVRPQQFVSANISWLLLLFLLLVNSRYGVRTC